jgi:hypothetical protein
VACMMASEPSSSGDADDENISFPLAFSRSTSSSSLLPNSFPEDIEIELPLEPLAEAELTLAIGQTLAFETSNLLNTGDGLRQAINGSFHQNRNALPFDGFSRASETILAPVNKLDKRIENKKRGSKPGEPRGKYNCGRCGRSKRDAKLGKFSIPHNCPFVARVTLNPVCPPHFCDASTNTKNSHFKNGYAHSESPSASNSESEGIQPRCNKSR